MTFDLLKNKSWWVDSIFYFSLALLIIAVFFYFVFSLKIYLHNQRINEVNSKIAVYGTGKEKLYEKEVLDYQKKIGDFTAIVSNHKISSNIFSFVEKKTLPNTWFSDFSMSESTNEVRLLGESDNMEALSRQVQVFEQSKDYVRNISVLNSQVSPTTGKIKFTLSFSLDPKIFNYMSRLTNPQANPAANP